MIPGIVTSLISPPKSLRRYAIANLIGTIGTGLTVTGGVLYFMRVIDASAREVGAAITVGAIIGLIAMAPIGRLADLYAAKRVYVCLLLTQSAALIGWLAFAEPYGLLVALPLSVFAERGINAVVGGYVADLTDGPERVEGRAYLRAITNVGLSVGGLAAAVALWHGSEKAFEIMVLAAACMPLVTATLVGTTQTKPKAQPTRQILLKRRAFRDRRYMILAISNGVMAVHVDVLAFALPVWVSTQVDAPTWSIGAAICLNAVIVVFFQIPIARKVTVDRIPRLAVRCGLLLTGSFALLAAAAFSPVWLSVVLLLAWVLTHSLAEMRQSSIEFCVSYEAAPEHAHGEYQSVYALGRGAVRSAAPAGLALAMSVGLVGWLVLGILCVTASLVQAAVVRQIGDSAAELVSVSQ